MKPACGPYLDYGAMYLVIPELVDRAPTGLRSFMLFLASPGFVVPLLLTLVIWIYYLDATSRKRRLRVEDLETELFTVSPFFFCLPSPPWRECSRLFILVCFFFLFFFLFVVGLAGARRQAIPPSFLPHQVVIRPGRTIVTLLLLLLGCLLKAILNRIKKRKFCLLLFFQTLLRLNIWELAALW